MTQITPTFRNIYRLVGSLFAVLIAAYRLLHIVRSQAVQMYYRESGVCIDLGATDRMAKLQTVGLKRLVRDLN